MIFQYLNIISYYMVIIIITKNKKLHFTASTLRHFGNVLVKMVAEWQLYFSDDIKNMETREDDTVEGK